MKLVSTLTPEFWPGLQTLAWSLREKGNLSGMEWIVIWDGKPPANAKRILEDNGFSMTFLQSRDLGSPFELGPTRERFRWLGNKMLIWNLPTELYCYLDADLLCINDARGLLKLQHFSVAPDGVGKKVRMFSWRRPHINTGFMVYRPTPELMQEMVEFQKGPLAPETYRYADQDLISYFFHNIHPRSIHYLPAKWNMLKRIYVKVPKKWNLEDIIFIHYVGKKPWDVIEAGYEMPHNLWRSFYFQAGGPDLNQE